MLIIPWEALLPWTLVPGPLSTSTPEASSSWPWNNSLTLQNPEARSGMLSSAVRNAPQPPAPVSTGERMAVRFSWPFPLLIHTPATLSKISLA